MKPVPCPNCGRPLAGRFCDSCGQERPRGPFTLRRVGRRTLSALVDLEEGTLATVVGLLRAPGRVVREYWSGRTRRYANPAKFFFLAFALAQFTAWRSGAFGEFIEGFMAGLRDEVFFTGPEAVDFLGDSFVLVVAAALPVPTFLGWIGTGRTLAEHFIFSFFVFGQVALVGSVALLAWWALDTFLLVAALIAALPVYYAWAVADAFDRPWWWAALRALVVLLLSTFVVALLLGVGMGLAQGMAAR